MLHRSDLAASGAGAGVLAFGLQHLASRAQRRRLRQDRADLRGRLHELETTVSQLRRDMASVPSFLLPSPPPSPTTGPLPIVDAFDRAAAPATPRSLPILTANRRGLQSCAPGLPGLDVPATSARGIEELAGAVADLASALPTRPRLEAGRAMPPIGPLLPGQRPPATPITGLSLPPVPDPAITPLEPGPADPLLDTAGLPILQPGPSVPVAEHPAVVTPAGSTASPAASVASVASAVTGPGVSAEAGATVIDLRVVADPAPATLLQPSAAAVDALVFSAIAEAEADAFTITMEQPGRAAASLFEPLQRPRQDGLSWAFDDVDRAVAETRAAARAMRPGIPPSPFFTPGAFVARDSERGDHASGRHSA